MMKTSKYRILICLALTTLTLLLSACKNSASKKGTASVIMQQPGPETGQTSLQEAALSGQAEVVDALLEQGIDINTRDQDGRTALMYAAFNGHEDIVKSLMEHGADVNMKDSFGRTALMFGSTGPFPGTVKILLDGHAEIDVADAEEHFTALMYAAAEGQLEVVELLLQYGADVSLKDVDGDMAETFARNNGHTEVAERLSSASR